MNDLWVFAYGSLMWRPGFEAVEARRARLAGYRRALCVSSHVHRGTRERPGLVLGLDRGGACVGRAFRVDAAKSVETLAYLRERELVTNVYHERHVSLTLDDGRRIGAVAYVVDRGHEQYAGSLNAEEAASRVIGAAGISGVNVDYVLATVEHLRELGIRDHWLEHVARLIKA
ncbi:MAG: gamma-glutamylcyclotransferase [Phyllobacteriaceae bacterium]|nr:gamma-glutamylcyclotransferase [Phyllobacteriaceae bacterium]